MDHPYNFRTPDFHGDVDAKAHLDATPDDAVVKGLFFDTMLKMLASLPAELQEEVRREVPVMRPRYLPFLDYPLREHMELSFAVVPRLFPDVPTRQAFRQMGWNAFPDFAGTMLGRVIYGNLGTEDLVRVFEAGPRGIAQAIKPGFAEVSAISDDHVRMEYYDIYGILDPYYIGVAEGTVRHYGKEPTVKIHTIDIANAVLDIRWR